MVEIWHGTQGGYTNHQCRCTACRAAWARWTAKARDRRAENVPPEIHGTYNGYVNYRCRCAECKQAQREYHQAKTAEAEA